VQNGTAAQQQNYSFDPLGNRLTKSLGTTSPTITAYVHDAANQLKEIRSGSATGTLLATLTYDADGNLKTRSDSGITFTYDALNRLTQATQSGQPTQTYVYDDEGRRIQKTVGGTATNYLYSGVNLVAEYAATWGSPVAQYTYGPMIDNIITRITASTTQYFHQDGLNSVMAATNTVGGTDATQRFDAWGIKVASTGTAPHYGYTGREPDETGLIYYRARYYDPTQGRFTQRDPIGLAGGVNRYAYANGNPLLYTDPLGLWFFDVNFTGGNGRGGTVGVQIGPAGVFVYGGVGYGTGGGASVTLNTGDPSPGLSVSATVSGGTGTVGGIASGSYSSTGVSGSVGIGWGVGFGTAVTGTYTYPIWQPDKPDGGGSTGGGAKDAAFSGEHGGGGAVGNIFER
jgi:RHS repeat-associated protein